MSRNDPADPLSIACAVEGEGYLRHCAAMLHSLLSQHPGGDVRIDCLHCGDTSPRSRAQLTAMINGMGAAIAFHRVPDDWVAGLPVKGFTRKATWYRIYLDKLLPVDRVIYLDVDLLVLDSLLPLWQTPLDGCVLGAVTNVPQLHHRPYVERPELGGDRYFNAGVLLMDLDLMRREAIGEELRTFSVANAPRLDWRDQDALNEVLHARRLSLHPRWNCMNSVLNFAWADEYFDLDELKEARHDPAIRHFEGPDENKPWHLLCDRETRVLYSRHRTQTPWRRVRSTGRTPVNVIRWAHRRFV